MKRRSFQTIHYLLVLLIGIGATVLESQGQWKKMPTETNNTLWSLDFTDTSRGWAIGSYGKILTTQQGGRSWRYSSSGDQWQLFDIQALNHSIAYIASEYCRVYYTKDTGQTWMKSITCGTGWLTAIHMWNKDTGFVVGAGGRVQWTTDGQNWSDISTPTQDHLYDLTFVGRDTGYIVGEGGLILRSVDSGRTWNTHSDTAMATLRAITVIQDTLYAVGEKGLILRSPDRGNEWNKMVTPVKQDLLDVTFRQGTGYAVGGQGTILRWAATDTAGWQLQQTPTQQLLSSVDFLTPRIGYVSGAQGVVLKTTNGGITSRSLSPVTSYNINIRPQPVHHTATVTLYVPHESRPIEQYSLVIYDVQGQRITTIDRGNRNADRYVFHFSTSDLTAGLYFYEVKYEQQSVAQGKLVVQ